MAPPQTGTRSLTTRRWTLAMNVAGLMMLTASVRAWAENPSSTTQPETVQAASRPCEEPKPKPGPKYALLRYDDDFSYLDGPEGSYTPDFFDPIKRIHIGENLIVGLGGEARGRMEAVTNKNFGKNQGRFGNAITTEDTYFLHRYYYHANIQYQNWLRVYVEGIDAWAEHLDPLTPLSNYQDRFDAHQLFIDLKPFPDSVPLTLRVGRQEFNYGKQRVIGVSDWSNVRRIFDAIKLIWSDKTWNVDAFYAKPVTIYNKSRDTYDEDIDFYGIYSTYKGIKNHGIDFYFLAVDNTSGNYTNANYRSRDIGDLCVYTIGSRFFGKTDLGPGTWDYDTELGGQWGKASSDTIQAWMWSMDTGYTFNKVKMKPRIGMGLDYASGDENPFDDIHQTWNLLYATGHSALGYIDQVGRQNIWSPNVNLTFKPLDKVTTYLAYYAFWLDKNRDALYGTNGRPTQRNVFGDVGNYVGDELDVTIQWEIDPHATMLFGYSHFWQSRHFFTRKTREGEDTDLFYLQFKYQF